MGAQAMTTWDIPLYPDWELLARDHLKEALAVPSPSIRRDALGTAPFVVQTGVWTKDDPVAQAQAEKKMADRNAAIHAIRCRIEKIFGTWKRSYGDCQEFCA